MNCDLPSPAAAAHLHLGRELLVGGGRAVQRQGGVGGVLNLCVSMRMRVKGAAAIAVLSADTGTHALRISSC